MQGKTILIIDDDLAFSEMLSEILKDEGAEVCVANDGVAGLTKAEEVQPDLIMCDVMMPRMTGMEVLQKIRTASWGTTVPFILLTNMTQPEGLEQVQQISAAHTECLLKTDWTLDDIAKKIQGLLA